MHTVREAWNAFFEKTLKELAPPPGEHEEKPQMEAMWEEIVRLKKDEAWSKTAAEKQPKFSMWYNALVSMTALL